MSDAEPAWATFAGDTVMQREHNERTAELRAERDRLAAIVDLALAEYEAENAWMAVGHFDTYNDLLLAQTHRRDAVAAEWDSRREAI